MHASDCNNVIKLDGHLESLPDSPAEADNKEAFVPLLLEVFCNTSKSRLDSLIILSLDTCDNFSYIHLPIVGFGEEFREIDIISERGPCISEGLVFAAGGTEDVRDEEERFAALFADMIAGGVGDWEDGALGLVVGLEARP
jgi:hypothetical protein